MKVSRAWLQTYFATPIPEADKLAELFTFHSFEVEGIETTDGAVLDLKILPDRAHYCLSHRGVAEEIAVLMRLPLQKNATESDEKKGKNKSDELQTSVIQKVTIEDPAFCRRFTARVVENLAEHGELTTHDDRIARALVAIGQRSINPVVDITNFVMFDIGQPTHAFDADMIKGDIVIRAARPGEKITLLDGNEYTLEASDHVIADASGPLDIAGVKGGKRAEVTAATRNILLTSANFHPTAVRRTSTRLNLRNEASRRFENEITPELAIEGLSMLSEHIRVMSPSVRFGPVIDIYPVKARQTVIELDPNYVNERLGVKVPEETMRDILERMGIAISNISNPKWSLTIPFHRLDLVIPEDIVEEIGRIYGYEHITGTPLPNAAAPQSSPMLRLVEAVKHTLIVNGFSEVYIHTLVPKGDIRVAYPLASDKAALRTSLAAGLKTCLEMNAHNAELLGLGAVKVFEIGKVFTKNAETLMLGLAAVQVKKVKGVDGKSLITAALERIKAATGIELPVKSLHASGVTAMCEIELDRIAVPASFSPLDIDFKNIQPKKDLYRPFSPYPFIVRDIAVFVTDADAQNVWSEIESGLADAKASPLLVRHSLFDTFKKDGKTSYAFRLVFQSMDRTLTDAETNDFMTKIYARMAARGWQVR